mgnify:CR=1 FL=1
MTTTPIVLAQAAFLGTTADAVYESTNCRTAIDKITATNRAATNQTATVHIVPAGESAGESNAVSKLLAPGESWTFPALVGHNLAPGDSIAPKASAVDSVWFRASGRQFT